MDKSKDWSISVAIFIVGWGLWYLIRRNSPPYYISKGLFEGFIFAFLVISGQTILWISRYYMGHVTVDGFTGSILGKPVLVRDSNKTIWAIFNTGESLEPFHFRGKLATLVVPWKQLRQGRKNFVGLTFAKRFPIKKLPPAVYSYLVHNASDFNTQKIFFGKYSAEFIHNNPEVADFDAMIENLHNQINFRDNLLEGRNDEIIEMVELGKQLSGNEKKWYEFMKRSKDADSEVGK